MSGRQKQQENTQSLANLTQDALKHVAACCTSHELAMLSRTSRSYYVIFQPILWKHPKLLSLPALMKFTNYVQRPHQDFKNVSDEDTYKQACRARVELVETVHIRVPATSADMDGASDCIKRLSKICPKARMSLLLLRNIRTNYKPLTEMFPGVLFFMFTSSEDRTKNVGKDLAMHKISQLCSDREEIARDTLKQVFLRDLSDNPHFLSKERAAKGDILSIDIEVRGLFSPDEGKLTRQVAVERNLTIKPGYAWSDPPLRPIQNIFWRQSNDMDERLCQLDRLPGPWIRKCVGVWTAEELEDETLGETFW